MYHHFQLTALCLIILFFLILSHFKKKNNHAFLDTSKPTDGSDWPLLTSSKSKRFKDGSQGGQDGILEWIFKNIGTTNKYFIEFGFNTNTWEGGTGPNCRILSQQQGWTGLLLDGSHENLSINLHRHYLYDHNIISIFRLYQVPLVPDYVSIDLDSIDIWIFKAIITSPFRPRVISVEYNCVYPLLFSLTATKTNQFQGHPLMGSSLLALNLVAEPAGYVLIATELCLDAFFVRKDLLKDTVLPSWMFFENVTGRADIYMSVFSKMDVKYTDQILDYATFILYGEEKSKQIVPYYLTIMRDLLKIDLVE